MSRCQPPRRQDRRELTGNRFSCTLCSGCLTGLLPVGRRYVRNSEKSQHPTSEGAPWPSHGCHDSNVRATIEHLIALPSQGQRRVNLPFLSCSQCPNSNSPPKQGMGFDHATFFTRLSDLDYREAVKRRNQVTQDQLHNNKWMDGIVVTSKLLIQFGVSFTKVVRLAQTYPQESFRLCFSARDVRHVRRCTA
jgi:hypothetical protein